MKTGQAILVAAMTLLMGCEAMSPGKPELEGEMDVIDATGLNDIMLTVANPAEAVAHFRAGLARQPDNVEFQRGLALSLMRAKEPAASAPVWDRLVASGKATDGDRLNYAEALINTGSIPEAQAQLDLISPAVQTYKRFLLEAIVADNNKDWARADEFYETARGLTSRPAPVLNNWGMSLLARGKNQSAAGKFQEAISFDPEFFTAKNNLVVARARSRNYRLPVVPMSELEEAVLLYNIGLIATRNNDTSEARGLFEQSIETHPRHYPEAVAALEALSGTVGG